MKRYTAIGLMSGTSLDGIDAALIETDGRDYVRPLGFLTESYDPPLREALRACFGKKKCDAQIRRAEKGMTLRHAGLVKRLLAHAHANLPESQSSDHQIMVGFHGQTIYHNPAEKLSLQIGDAELLARKAGLDVVSDFRSADIAAGGQGAPLAPLYHAARLRAGNVETPAAVLNIGGVANVSWISKQKEDIIAFDTGPGNALMDDYCKAHANRPFDENGHLAAKGHADQEILERWMAHPYFSRKPPKSLDRNEWDIAELGPLAEGLKALSTEDALATLAGFTVRSVAAAFDHFPQVPKALYVCGGGRRNETLMASMALALPCPVQPVEALGWNGDATEAECFAYLAVRSVLELPITFPGTTGVSEAMTGGKAIKATS